MEQSETHDQLRREFAGLGIPMDAPGFYDHPAFVAIEKKNPKFLEAYAKFVQSRPIDRTYIAQVRQVVGIVGPMWNEELVLDGRLGACIDLSMVLSRTLESGGVWNYVVKGALTIEFPKNSGYGKTYFWPIDIAKVAAGHVWVCAPPYSIIDLTIQPATVWGPSPETRAALCAVGVSRALLADNRRHLQYRGRVRSAATGGSAHQ